MEPPSPPPPPYLRADVSYFNNVYKLAINEWGYVGYEELCRSKRLLSAEVDNTLRDLHNSTKAEFINCFIIYSSFENKLKHAYLRRC